MALIILTGVVDVCTYRIPHILTGMIVGLFIFGVALEGSFDQILLVSSRGVSALIILLLGFVFFIKGWVGGGDVKYAAALSLWMGSPAAVMIFLLYSGFFGGVLTLAVLAFRSYPLPLWGLKMSPLLRLHSPQQGVPYGVALSLAALMMSERISII